jgi:hypothetical protein
MATDKQPLDIPTQICEKFLEALKTEGLEETYISKLRKVMITDEQLTETAIRNAIAIEKLNHDKS